MRKAIMLMCPPQVWHPCLKQPFKVARTGPNVLTPQKCPHFACRISILVLNISNWKNSHAPPPTNKCCSLEGPSSWQRLSALCGSAHHCEVSLFCFAGPNLENIFLLQCGMWIYSSWHSSCCRYSHTLTPGPPHCTSRFLQKPGVDLTGGRCLLFSV